MKKVLQLDPKDNVLIALSDLKQNDPIEFSGSSYLLISNVPAKHKFATEDLAAGSDVIMYGVLVGKTFQPVRKRELLSLANIRHEAAPYREKTSELTWTPPDVSRWKTRKFLGFHRADGQVGTRNCWLVVPLVFCENRNILNLKQALEEELGFAPPPIYRQYVAELARLHREGNDDEITVRESHNDVPRAHSNRLFPNVDGIKFLLHEGGCGGTREDSNNLCGLIAGYIHHPNVAGATILSLGCQHAQVAELEQELRKRDPDLKKPLLIFEQQQSGLESKMLSDAVRATFLGLIEMNKAKRQPAP